jgi:hypothetical protein
MYVCMYVRMYVQTLFNCFCRHEGQENREWLELNETLQLLVHVDDANLVDENKIP